jgi:hypothetical protein
MLYLINSLNYLLLIYINMKNFGKGLFLVGTLAVLGGEQPSLMLIE